ncbi:hypothetical protein BvRS1_55660 [Burkholderia vietnamiensis]|nr:hypothetical protein BvRS1_55660 [Burkholderia vietnamiensis]
METPAVERVRERPDDVLLADERSEILRTPLACENLIGHREIVSVTPRRADTPNGTDDGKHVEKNGDCRRNKNARRTGREER